MALLSAGLTVSFCALDDETRLLEQVEHLRFPFFSFHGKIILTIVNFAVIFLFLSFRLSDKDNENLFYWKSRLILCNLLFSDDPYFKQ